MVAVSSETLRPASLRRGAGDEVEGRGGVEHPTARARVDKDGNVGEAEGIFADLERERVAGLDGHGRVGLGQRQQLERHLDLVLLVGAELRVQAGVEGLVGLGGLGPVAEAQVVFGERLAQQLFVGRVAAGAHLIDERRRADRRIAEVVGAVGQNAAIELRLIGRKLVELRGRREGTGDRRADSASGYRRRGRWRFRFAVAYRRRLLARRAIGFRERPAGTRPAAQIAVRVLSPGAGLPLAHSAARRSRRLGRSLLRGLLRDERGREENERKRNGQLAKQVAVWQVSRGAGCFAPQVRVRIHL